jgi:hypothetical protein
MERLRPAVRRAAQALCAADTPAAALAAAAALDVACHLAGFSDLGAACAIESNAPDETVALTEALLCGMSVATLAALLRSGDARATCLSAALIIAKRNHTLPQAALLLDNRTVLHALLDALIAADATAAPDVPVAGGAPTRSGLAEVPPMLPLDDLLIAIHELRVQWPRTPARLLEAPQRLGVMRCLARRYRPLERRAREHGPEKSVHRSAVTLLQGLSCSVASALVWDNATAAALAAGLPQGAGACH